VEHAPSETKRHPPEQRREAIIAAAARHFCEKGYEGTTIRDIARDVGVAEGLIYHYFPSKAELIVECWKRFRWQERLVSLLRETRDVPMEAALHRIFREHLQALYENGTAVRMHVAEMLRDGELAALSLKTNTETHDRVHEYLRSRQEAGDARPDLDPLVIAGTILGATFSFFFIHGRLPEAEWNALADHAADELTRLFMEGLRRRQTIENAE